MTKSRVKLFTIGAVLIWLTYSLFVTTLFKSSSFMEFCRNYFEILFEVRSIVFALLVTCAPFIISSLDDKYAEEYSKWRKDEANRLLEIREELGSVAGCMNTICTQANRIIEMTSSSQKLDQSINKLQNSVSKCDGVVLRTSSEIDKKILTVANKMFLQVQDMYKDAIERSAKEQIAPMTATMTGQLFSLSWDRLPFCNLFNSFDEEDKAHYFDSIRSGNYLKFRAYWLKKYNVKIK